MFKCENFDKYLLQPILLLNSFSGVIKENVLV